MSGELSKKETIVKMIKDAGEAGCTAQVILDALQLKPSQLHSTIHEIRKAHIILHVHSVYYYRGEKTEKAEKKQVAAPAPAPALPSSSKDLDVSQMLASRHFVKEVSGLNESDRKDLCDYLQKSLFYRLGAEAVIKSHRVVEEFKKQLALEPISQ